MRFMKVVRQPIMDPLYTARFDFHDIFERYYRNIANIQAALRSTQAIEMTMSGVHTII